MSPLRICPNGHRFNKTSDCPTCPHCEADRAPKDGWLSTFSAPARRALEHAGINNVAQPARRTQQEVLALHGMYKRANESYRSSQTNGTDPRDAPDPFGSQG